MKVAIIGSGIAGLTVADAIHQVHEITLFEAAAHVGGHTNTIDVGTSDQRLAIDTGFIVFNDRTYPHFESLLNRLNVVSQPAPMTFSVRCDESGLEYRGADLGGLFAQRRNLLRPRFYRLLGGILKFNRKARHLLAADDDCQTVREYFAAHKYSTDFYRKYFLPLGSAIWSCPQHTFEEFPIRFIAEFYHHHGMLGISDRPQWRVVCGGSRQYIKPLIRPFQDRIRLQQPVRSVSRSSQGVRVSVDAGWEHFDHVVFACHADQALRILGASATAAERDILSAFPYEKNEAVLHCDTSVLPKQRRAWAAWNYHLPAGGADKATLTYNMNILQSLSTGRTYCVTLNATDQIDPDQVIRRINYEHPIFDSRRRAMQSRHGELLGANHTSYCGAYWGNGFHEDGVVSGLAVAQGLLRGNGLSSPLGGDQDSIYSTDRNEQLHLRGSRVASSV